MAYSGYRAIVSFGLLTMAVNACEQPEGRHMRRPYSQRAMHWRRTYETDI